MRLLVMEYKVVDYKTFMDELRICDINWLLPQLHYSNRHQLENTRFICYTIAQSNSTKSLKPSDIMHFEWDIKEDNKKKNVTITKEDVERLKIIAKQREKEIKTINA